MDITTTSEALHHRLEPLWSFLSEAEQCEQEQLTSEQSDDLQALIDHVWPGAFDRQILLYSLVWFGVGVVATRYAFGV